MKTKYTIKANGKIIDSRGNISTLCRGSACGNGRYRSTHQKSGNYAK